MSGMEREVEPVIVIVEMTTTQYFLLGLASCVFWGIIGALLFFCNDSGGWHDFGAFVLLIDMVLGVEVLFCLFCVVVFGDGEPIRAQMINPHMGRPTTS